jgi:hypothetical protein
VVDWVDRFSPAGLGLALVAVAIAAAHGCDEGSALARLGDGCKLHSDCEAGLACIYGGCHQPCATSKDCPGGRCVFDPAKLHHCQLDAEAPCIFHSDCDVGLVCGIDGRCRNECADDRDCVSGQICVGATCAEPDELENGRLPRSPDVSALGLACRYSSQCPASPEGLALRCRAGRCAYDCFEERDCGRFETCTTKDDEAAPGECVLIGLVESLHCDPDEDPSAGHSCDCPDGSTASQFCKPDGSGYEPCACP